MSLIPILDAHSATEASREKLEAARKAFGFVPNLYGALAHSPAALQAYQTLAELFGQTSLSPDERHVVHLTVSRLNLCHYCMAAHSAIASMTGASEDLVAALRSGAPLPDSRLEALRTFTGKLVQKRGWLEDGDVQAFLAAGFGQQQVLEVVLGVTQKTLSNYANHLAGTPVDAAFAQFTWKDPSA